MYSTSLFYDSLPESLIIRVPSLNLPIHCQYNRFHYSYKVGFQPEVQHAIYAKTLRSKLVFSLTVCNAQWEAVPPGSSFLLGEQLYFIAQAGFLVSGERLYVDSCYASSSKDPNSLPKVHLITNYGYEHVSYCIYTLIFLINMFVCFGCSCMMDSRREGSDSRFVWRGANELRFSVDAFLFKASQVQYLHCSMSVDLTASDTSKTCNYNRAAGRWEEMESFNLVCACCDSVCNEKKHSIKHTTSSIGWHVKLNDGNPSTRTSVSAAEEIFFVKKGNKGVNPDLQVGEFQRSAITGPKETTQWKMGTITQEATKERTSNVTNIMAVDHLKGGAFNGILSDESRASISNQLREEFESKSSLVGIFNDSGKVFSNTANLDTIYNTSDHCTDIDVVVLTEIPHTPKSKNTSGNASDVSIHFYNKSAEFNWKNSNQSLDSHNLDAR
uniref:Zona pellucida sperm-binding protein 3-like n=1 Tax=Gouania willdenowi TaxID=441366 RepID=A0A8C5D7X2_GOUWI